MKRLLFTLVLIYTVVLSYAQTSLRPGYIVTTDTIRGLVVYHENAQAIRVCSFKKQGSSESADYTPADIKGYGFESRYFTSVLYKGNLQFMEVIAAGPISLLRSNRFYYLVKDTTFALLATEKMEKYINGRRYEYEDKTWLGRVKPMLSDCQATAKALDGVKLAALSPQQMENKFSKIVIQYSECRGEKTRVYEMAKSKRIVSFGFFGGVTNATVNITYSGSTIKYSGSAPVLGLSFEWSNLRLNERLRFRAEVSYTKMKVDDTDQYDVHRSVNYSAVKVPILVHYSFLSGRVSPFVRLGVAPTSRFSSRYAITFPGVYYESSDFEKFTMPFVAGGGLETALGGKLRCYVEARYEVSSLIYSNNQLKNKVRVSQLAFQLGVRF